MIRLSYSFAVACSLLTGCTPSHAARVPHLVFGVPELREDEAVSGQTTFLAGWLENTGTGSAAVSVAVTAPFTLPTSTVRIAPGARARVVVAVVPDAYAPLSGTLTFVTPLQTLAVPLVLGVDPDADGDGHDAVAVGGDDCDDSAAGVFPGAVEVCDGVDQDCDGDPDDDATDASLWFADGDDDGWGGSALGPACDRPAAGAIKRGGDCDDRASAVNPDAAEVWYDGVDQDCDGRSDHDQDFDGYDAAPVGADCNDRAASVNPGELEIWYDGLDEDCSGGSDYDQDGDGVDVIPSGFDCDDTDAEILPGEPEVDDLVDQDCDGFADEDFLARGDLAFTELMVDPTQVDDEDGQYVEITNLSARPVAVLGFRVTSAGGSVRLTDGVVPVDGAIVVCANADVADNGGITCDARLGAAVRSADRVRLLGPVVLDELDTAGWTVTAGAAWELAIGFGPDDNDDEAAWCLATETYGSGDLGTPGAANPGCP